MSINFSLILFYAWFALISGIMAWLSAILAIHFAVPRAMLDTYFREPYFSPFEVEFFTGFPFAYMRTVMFMRLAGWPESGRKRGLTEVYKLAPPWFQLLSRVCIRILIILCSLLMLLLIISFVKFDLMDS